MYAKLKTYKDGAYDLAVPSTYLCRQNAQRRHDPEDRQVEINHFTTLTSGNVSTNLPDQQRFFCPYIWAQRRLA